MFAIQMSEGPPSGAAGIALQKRQMLTRIRVRVRKGKLKQ